MPGGGFSLDEYDIEILNAHSDTNFRTPVEIAKKLNIPYSIVCDNKAFPKIREEFDEHKIFNLGKDDFVDFLEDEFKVCCKKIPELEAAKGKPQKTMVILQSLKDEEIKDSTKIKDLANFIKKNLLL